VKVNGEIVTTPGVKVDTNEVVIEVDGEVVPIASPRRHTYLMLHKPPGVLCSRGDPHHQRTVYDLLPPEHRRLHYVGRLDKESEGLLLFTDDGNLTYRLTHPRHKVEKTYLVEVRGLLGKEQLAMLRSGIILDDGATAPAKVRVISRQRNRATVEVRIYEGRKRQVRRMMAALGCEVIRLIRTGVGGVSLGSLKSGHWRHLTAKEVALLTLEQDNERPANSRNA